MPLLAPGHSRMLRSHKALLTRRGGQIARSLGETPHQAERPFVVGRDSAVEG